VTQGESGPFYNGDFSIRISVNQDHLLVDCKICGMIIANFDTAILPIKIEDIVKPALAKHVHRMG
jgi:hypothetical protein